jgi:hypothetical protein
MQNPGEQSWQWVWPDGHWHVPLTQLWPLAVHAVPQVPQLFGSVLVLVQAPPQAVWPEGQAQ